MFIGDRSQDVGGSGETIVAGDGNGSVEHFPPDPLGLDHLHLELGEGAGSYIYYCHVSHMWYKSLIYPGGTNPISWAHLLGLDHNVYALKGCSTLTHLKAK